MEYRILSGIIMALFISLISCTNARSVSPVEQIAISSPGIPVSESTPVPKPVVTPTPTPILTPSPTPVPTSTPTPIPTPEPAPTPTLTPTPTPIHTPTPRPTPTPSPVPVFKDIPLSYEVVRSYVNNAQMTQTNSLAIGSQTSKETKIITIYEATLDIKNTDIIAGDFRVSFSVAKPFDNYFLNKIITINPGETKTVKCPAYELGNWTYTVQPPFKKVQQ